MQAPAGGYWSTLDADSEGHEGKFYVWDAAQVRALVPGPAYDAFARRFGLDQPPNFEGLWHLHSYRPEDEIATELGLDATELRRRLDEARGILLAQRNRRIWPGRDEKVLTSWNGLAIAGMAAAARALSRPDLAESATRAVDFIRDHLWRDGRLLAVHKDGQSRFPAYLDDYAFLLDGLIELLQTRWRSVRPAARHRRSPTRCSRISRTASTAASTSPQTITNSSCIARSRSATKRCPPAMRSPRRR